MTGVSLLHVFLGLSEIGLLLESIYETLSKICSISIMAIFMGGRDVGMGGKDLLHAKRLDSGIL